MLDGYRLVQFAPDGNNSYAYEIKLYHPKERKTIILRYEAFPPGVLRHKNGLTRVFTPNFSVCFLSATLNYYKREEEDKIDIQFEGYIAFDQEDPIKSLNKVEKLSILC